MCRRLALCGLFLGVLTAPAQAATIQFTVSMDASQATISALPGATGSGSGTITLETVTNLLSWNLSWSGTQGTALFSHLHGAAAPGAAAPARYFLTTDASTSGSGSFTLTDPVQINGAAYLVADQVADLMAGLWYVNVHTTHSNQGEIRGQVVLPEPSVMALGLFAAGAFALVRRVR